MAREFDISELRFNEQLFAARFSEILADTLQTATRLLLALRENGNISQGESITVQKYILLAANTKKAMDAELVSADDWPTQRAKIIQLWSSTGLGADKANLSTNAGLIIDTIVSVENQIIVSVVNRILVERELHGTAAVIDGAAPAQAVTPPNRAPDRNNRSVISIEPLAPPSAADETERLEDFILQLSDDGIEYFDICKRLDAAGFTSRWALASWQQAHKEHRGKVNTWLSKAKKRAVTRRSYL